MTWMDFKMADTSERRVFCNTILLKYHDLYIDEVTVCIKHVNIFRCKKIILFRRKAIIKVPFNVNIKINDKFIHSFSYITFPTHS